MISLYCNVCKQDHGKKLAKWCDRSSIEIENEKLKKALKISLSRLTQYSHRARWNHARSEAPTFYLQGSEDKGYEMADKALKEIEEVLK